ncbi:lymphocyte antigen 75-like [Onychostoma macrolepis]|uniref:lymphocyte antigen 75-like n=1 Tax=Onychostoma macrolepis TaxID=369639 RepID=UPI0027294F43|nr:lymphocyte antigen 75-like [Onychostoma macrolepis]
MAPKAMITVFLFLSLFGLNISIQHYYVNNSMKWSDAQSYSKNYYDDLSTVSNEELQLLSENPQVTTDFYWIGLKRASHILIKWKWTGGDDATDVNWDENQPDSVGEQCGAVKKSTSKVHDAYCGLKITCYCMEDLDLDLILVQQESTWEEALLYCRQNYKDLAILNSDEIMTEARVQSTAALTDNVWIGLRFIAGHWFWANGEAFGYKVWSSGGELQCPMNQCCAVLNRNSMGWKPVDCEKRLNFFCIKK